MVKAALKNPYAVVVLALAILVIGVTAITRLPTDILPIFRTPAVQVLTFYPGMPAEIMEKDITTRLERWTGQANGIARQESKSMVGVSILRDFFREDVDPNTAMAQVTSLAMSDLYYLPPGTIPPMVMPFDPTASIPLALISVSSPTFDETKLYDVAYFDLRNRLQSISGVIAPAVYGGRLRRILAYVDPVKAQARGLAPLDVINAIRDFNVMIPTGNAKFGMLDYQINANGMVREVVDLNDIPITTDTGPPIYVRDVAKVEDAHQIQSNIVHINGKRQVYIPIYRQPGANTIAVVDGIRAALKPILERIKGINLDVVMDQSVYVREAIRNLVQVAVIGSLLAAIMVLVFLGSYRPMLIVLVMLPLACLGAFIGLYFTKESINAMTLGGLALAVGLLIDQSIVVLENTARHLSLGKSPWNAAHDGANEVARPVLIITITIAVVFFPVVFLSGLGKFLFTPLAKTVIFARATSFVLAMTLVPVCAARFLRRRSPRREEGAGRVPNPNSGETEAASSRRQPHAEEAGWFPRLRSGYENLLRHVLRLRWAVLAGVAALFIVSIGLFKFIGTELFPQTDAGLFMIRMRAPTGLRIERTEALVSKVEDLIRATIPEHDRKMVIGNIGVLYDWPAAYTPNSGSQDAFILVQLTENHKRSSFEYVDQLRAKLPREFPGTEFNFDTGGMLTAALNTTAPSEINHVNVTRVTDVFVNVRGRDIGSVAADIEKYIDKIRHDRKEVPEGYFIQMRGEVKSMQESFKSLGFGLMLAVVLVYLVMVVQFRSFLDPFIVMFAVPLGLIGVAWMLFLTGINLNIQSLMGIILMVGIVVSFSVLLVDFANRVRAEAREKGIAKSAHDAVIEAAGIRLRPILMTALAAVVGILPMAIAGGASIPLARAVVGGVSTATLLVLFVVPILYLLLKGDKQPAQIGK